MKRKTREVSPAPQAPRRKAAAMLSRPILVLIFLITAALALTSWPGKVREVSAARQQEISESVVSQIQALMAAKRLCTPAQQKLDSNLLAAAKMSRGEPVAQGVPSLEVNVETDAAGRALVDIKGQVTDALLKQIESFGGEVSSSFPQYDSVRALVPVSAVESLADMSEVRFIRRAVKAQTQRASLMDFQGGFPITGRGLELRRRAPEIRAQLHSALARAVKMRGQDVGPLSTLVGSATSAGDTAHTASNARTTFSVNGTGVKIAVLSDSYNNLGGAAADVVSGDLPGPGNPNGFTTAVTIVNGDLASGGSDEGRAMLQIVHDLAPGARLYFATAFNSDASFAQNIRDLRNIHGCDIIIDDVGYFDESPFQDGIIAQAVNDVTAAGALFFSSAGNSGNLNDGTSGVWEGDFLDSGSDLVIDGTSAGRLHSFGAALFNTVNNGGSSRFVNVFWSDALAHSANDYDVYVINAAGTSVLRSSTAFQTGTQDPYEFIDTLNVGEKIAIVKFAGSARFIHLDTGRGRLSIPTAGQTRGHNSAVNAFNVAAVSASTAGGGAFVGGVTNPVETFSSDGPRRVFYNANGTAITPGNFLSTGGAVRQKPDIAAADGVATTLPGNSGLNPFFGTSAAAPHAGAVAGLLKSLCPSLTASQIRSILTSTALDIEGAGTDRDSGAGIVMAVAAMQNACPTTRTLTVASTNPASGVSITVSPNDNSAMGNGSTQFTRTYNNNVVVSLTAPATAGGNNFQKWQKDGVDAGVTQAINVTMDANHTMTAIYVTPTRTLTVASSNPASGVSITVSPNDNSAMGNGSTQFTRTYNNNVVVSLTAPATAGGNNFQKWQKDGVDAGVTQAINVTMDANHTMTAIYVTPPTTRTLTVASTNPASGVSITVSPNDNSAMGNGSTQFTRTYNNNVVVSLTAPATAGGNNFQKWQKDGVDAGVTQAINVTMDANHTMTAIYVSNRKAPFDFDMDNKTDLSVFRPSEGRWYISLSSNGGNSLPLLGVGTDQIVPGNYDGDMKADTAIWRPSNGNWIIMRSSDSVQQTVVWGVTGDIPVPGDYDGDGKTDIAVWRPLNGVWFIINSSNNTFSTIGWGVTGDIPVPADYDGDGKTDIAAWRPSTGVWYIINSSNGSVSVYGWGVSTDKVVPADYDGDGKTDIAAWRPSTGVWYIINSSNGSVSVYGWGVGTDKPVMGDFDGDGKVDIAVWRSTNGVWYIINSSNSSVRSDPYGVSTDLPVPAAYIR